MQRTGQMMAVRHTRTNSQLEIAISSRYHHHHHLLTHNIDGLAQDCSNSIANALELLQSCTKPSIYLIFPLYPWLYWPKLDYGGYPTPWISLKLSYCLARLPFCGVIAHLGYSTDFTKNGIVTCTNFNFENAKTKQKQKNKTKRKKPTFSISLLALRDNPHSSLPYSNIRFIIVYKRINNINLGIRKPIFLVFLNIPKVFFRALLDNILNSLLQHRMSKWESQVLF